MNRIGESDEQRLAEETRTWADTVPGTVRIAAAPLRLPVAIAGVVRRITILPTGDRESLETLVEDGTGELALVFMGRRWIDGLSLGTRVVVEGVIAEQHGQIRMINPSFELRG
jgi:RecG-like helicase